MQGNDNDQTASGSPWNSEDLSLKEALAVLGIDKSTFYRYCEDGRLASYLHGGRTYVKPRWIDDYYATLAEEAVKLRAEKARARKARTRRPKRTGAEAKV